jgi:5'-nucleotidase/UDP-sugar diphosphatase
MTLRAFWRLILVIGISLWSSFSWGEPKELRIIHFNDFHGFARPHRPLGFKEEVGGAAWMASLAEHLRGEKPAIFLAAGDMIQGDNWANLFEGRSVIRLLNAMRIDAMVLGNHEFDFGPGVLGQRIKEANFPVLGANVVGMDGIRRHVVKKVGEARVGIIGVITAETPLMTHPRNVRGLKFLDPEEVLARELEGISKEVDIVVVLSHCGYSKDREIASRLRGIHVIVGGHSHTRLDEPVKVNDTIIVQAWEHGKTLGVLDISVDGGKVLSWKGGLRDIVPSRWGPDPEAMSIVEEYSRQMSQLLDTVVGVAGVDLDGENVRERETNFGNLVADLLREVSGAQVAMVNGGSIRRSIPRGPVTLDSIYSALPFDNYVVTLKIRGRGLWEALEHGVSGRGGGRFPQVSGIKITYCPQGEPGKRLREVRVGMEPLEMDRMYLLATNDFLAAGGDGYSSLVQALDEGDKMENLGGALVGGSITFSDPGRWVRELFAEKVKEKGTVSPSLEGRIVEACP